MPPNNERNVAVSFASEAVTGAATASHERIAGTRDNQHRLAETTMTAETLKENYFAACNPSGRIPARFRTEVRVD